MTTVQCAGLVTSFLTPTPTAQSLGIYLCSTQRQAGPDDISNNIFWKLGHCLDEGAPIAPEATSEPYRRPSLPSGKKEAKAEAAYVLKFKLPGSREWGFTEKNWEQLSCSSFMTQTLDLIPTCYQECQLPNCPGSLLYALWNALLKSPSNQQEAGHLVYFALFQLP